MAVVSLTSYDVTVQKESATAHDPKDKVLSTIGYRDHSVYRPLLSIGKVEVGSLRRRKTNWQGWTYGGFMPKRQGWYRIVVS